MTAIASTGRRLTTKRGESLSPMRLTQFSVTATKHVKAGGMVMLVAAGTVEPGATGTGNVCLGVSQTDSDNSGSLSPAPVAEIETGVFSMFQTGTTITKAHTGTTVYMADDQTVTLNDSGNSPAGTCVGIDDDGTSVLVAMSPVLPITSHGFSVQSATLTLTGGVDTVAGQGTGADTDSTARRYNFASVLPAGAAVIGHMVRIVTAFVGAGLDTLTLSIGTVTPTDDFDTINALTPLITTGSVSVAAGYTKGVLGDAPNSDMSATSVIYAGAQLTATLTPDASAKISEVTAGVVHIAIWYLDGTGI